MLSRVLSPIPARMSLGFRLKSAAAAPRIATRPSELVGNTPLLAPCNVVPGELKGRILLKMESMGPCSSVKDRLGKVRRSTTMLAQSLVH